MTRINEYGQPIGEAMPGWTRRPYPEGVTLKGRTCRVEALSLTKHLDDLFAALNLAPDSRDWTYMPAPFPSDLNYFRNHIDACEHSLDPKFFAVIDVKSGKAVGYFSFLRINPASGSIEVGHVTFSPLLKQTISSTEAQYLLMRYAFEELGYRRYEWKCDNLNAPSHNAAKRLGFQFEGVFRNAMVYKGRTRDTAWYSIIDTEWPATKKALETWLAPSNFDSHGKQIHSLAALRAAEE